MISLERCFQWVLDEPETRTFIQEEMGPRCIQMNAPTFVGGAASAGNAWKMRSISTYRSQATARRRTCWR
jgi:hypothetical protein